MSSHTNQTTTSRFGSKARDVWKRYAPDLRAVTAISCIAAAVGMTYICTWGGTPDFYQRYFGPAAMFAAGKGYVYPGHWQPLDNLLNLKSDYFDPATLPPNLPTGDVVSFHLTYRYLVLAVALTWRLFGISWSALLPLYSVFYAATVAAAYGLFRLGMRRSFAVTGALLLTISPNHLAFLPHLRDYSKAPFILLALCAMGYMVKRPLKKGTVLALAAACGATIGVGVGFRMDLMICVPAFLAIVAFFLPGPIYKNLGLKMSAIVLFAIALLIPAWPIFRSIAEGGNTFHFFVLGLTSQFDLDLGVGGVPYSLGSLYLDQFSHTLVNSYAHRVMNTTQIAPLYSPEWETVSKAFFIDYVRLFPADMAIRGYAAVLKIINELAFDTVKVRPTGVTNQFLIWCYDLRRSLCGLFLGRGQYFVAGLLIVLAARNLRAAIASLFLLLYFGGYCCLQFGLRHYFHLEFVGWWAVGFVIYHGYGIVRQCLRERDFRVLFGTESGETRRYLYAPVWRALGFAVGAWLVMWIPLCALRWYQDRNVSAYLTSYAGAAVQPLPLETAPAKEGRTLLKYPAQPPAVAERADAFPIQTQVAVLELGPGDSPVADMLIRYEEDEERASRSEIPPNDFSSWCTVRLDSSRTEGSASSVWVFVPIYESTPAYFASWRQFKGFEIPDKQLRCVRGLYRLVDLSPFPILVGAVFRPDWEGIRFHQVLQQERPLYIRARQAFGHNLLPNGDFEQWTPDGKAPLGFNITTRFSTVLKEMEYMAGGHAAVRQTWTKSDASEALPNLFSVEIPNLEPETTYEMFVKARNLSGAYANIVAWQLSPAGDGKVVMEQLALGLIRAAPADGYKEYSGQFRTLPRKGFTVLLCTYCPVDTPPDKFPVSVIWDDWRLTKLDRP